MRGREQEQSVWVWELEPDEMTNIRLRELGSKFASLPVLTFKMLNRGLDHLIRSYVVKSREAHGQ